jgi:LmbE family N-acetylglucosaminyl deacetylase
MTDPHIPTLMTVHAHPDDETIGTGGTMARSVAAGQRVILITGTRGEMGEIVVPDMDTPENHRRLGEIRAGELERAMQALAVTEWDNLGYRDSDMMGRAGNNDPRSFWRADLDEAAGRLVWMIRRFQPDVVTTYNDFGGYGHPDHIRVHDVTVRAYPRAGDPSWYPEQLAPEHGGTGRSVEEGGLAPWAPSKLYEQAIPASVRTAMRDAMEALDQPNPWIPPPDATPERLAEFEAFQARMLVPDESITTWIDISGNPLERKWKALHEHATQMAEDQFFMAFGLDGWREHWSKEAYILRESTVETDKPEDDLFAGLVPADQ